MKRFILIAILLSISACAPLSRNAKQNLEIKREIINRVPSTDVGQGWGGVF